MVPLETWDLVVLLTFISIPSMSPDPNSKEFPLGQYAAYIGLIPMAL